MEEASSADILQEQLNSRLGVTFSSGRYVFVYVLIIYWKESDRGDEYREEGESLGQLFKDHFQFTNVHYFPIPSTSCQVELRRAVDDAIMQLEKQPEASEGPGLLIIHYGGHGDPDDDLHAGEKRRAVWRARGSGGPSIQWFEIQRNLKHTEFDTLLLLDCCFAAQSGRGSDKSEGRIELLAASGSHEETPKPGPGSFTNGMIKEMKRLLEEEGYVSIDELHTRLMNRKAELYCVPFHGKLRIGPTEKSIWLRPFGRLPDTNQPEDWTVAVKFNIRMTERLDTARIKQLCHWLRTDAPNTVSGVRAEKILFRTADIENFIQQDLVDRKNPLVRTLDQPDLEDIQSAWSAIQSLIHQYTAQKQSSPLSQTNSQSALELSRRFLEEMDKGNSKIVETLEQSVLLSDEYSVPSMIEQAIEEPSSERLGIKDQLQLRKIVCAKSMDYGEQRTPEEPSEVPVERIMEEYKKYGENQSDADIQDIKARMALLAKVLECGKPEDFRALRLIRWEHQEFHYQFIYHFEIPRIYEGKHQSLFEAIKPPLSRTRPSLDQKFDMARCVAKAVQHWHSVGWVHQGICSHNIFFFIGKNQELDFSLPYLQGFDFSRPNLKPSLGRYVDDIRFDIYRHPDRQGPSRDGHRKSHDLYSLGVVLLEIGLWQRAIDIITYVKGKKKFTKEDVQNILIDAAKTRLAHYAGTNYQQAVCACLESEFGVGDDEGSRLARAVRERVIGKLCVGRNFQ